MDTLNIGDLKVRIPIIQGGMGICVSLSGLASAVANEGGIGVISAVGIGMTEPDYRKHFREANKIALRKEIRKARSKTDGVLGVNIMMAVSDFDELLRVSIEEGIDVAIIGAGLFLKMPENIDHNKTKIIPKVSSSRAAGLIFKYWSDRYNRVPDAVVVEGPLCGGHIGYKFDEIHDEKNSLYRTIPEVVKALSPYEQKYGIEIPVIAAGGIYTGMDMYNIMQLGAKAVKMGTRFVTTDECDVSEKFKQNYLDCREEDITLIDSPVGLPGRVISNAFVREIQQGKQKPVDCFWHCLKTCEYDKVSFCIAEALFNATKGDFDSGFSFAGSNAYKAEKIYSVAETFNMIRSEYQQELLASEKTQNDLIETGFSRAG